MNTIRALRGFSRTLFLLRLKVQIFSHFLPVVFHGYCPPKLSLQEPSARRRISLRQFGLFLRRLLLFLAKLDHNKYVRIGRTTRLDLYVPSFPSAPFYLGCSKFLEFQERPPCITVLLSLTSACRFSCPHCYQRLDHGKDVDLQVLVSMVRRLQNSGIAFFNIEGGEPFLKYERLKQVCAAIDGRSEIWVNSTGDGMNLERLKALRDHNLTAVMFSLHASEPERLNGFMGSEKAWDTLVKAVDLCHQAGVLVAFNACLQAEAFRNGEFDRVMDRAKEFGACLIQLIKPKPAGAWLQSGAPASGPDDLSLMTEAVNKYNHELAYKDYPAVAAQILTEHASRFGCTAGGTDRFYINAKGDVQPCEFLNLSFGNVMDEPFEDIYGRMRNTFNTPGEHWLCETCAPVIRDAAAQQSKQVLPLDKDATIEVLGKVDRGRPTKVYADVQKLT